MHASFTSEAEFDAGSAKAPPRFEMMIKCMGRYRQTQTSEVKIGIKTFCEGYKITPTSLIASQTVHKIAP